MTNKSIEYKQTLEILLIDFDKRYSVRSTGDHSLVITNRNRLKFILRAILQKTFSTMFIPPMLSYVYSGKLSQNT